MMTTIGIPMSMVGIARRMMLLKRSYLGRECRCFNSASMSLSSKLLHPAPICVIERRHVKGSLLCFGACSPLYVDCSRWRKTNANPHCYCLTQLPLQVPPLDHLRQNWIKPLLVRCFLPVNKRMNSLLIHRFWRSLVARAALRNRFAELGVSESKSGETTPLCMLFGFTQIVHWSTCAF